MNYNIEKTYITYITYITIQIKKVYMVDLKIK